MGIINKSKIKTLCLIHIAMTSECKCLLFSFKNNNNKTPAF